MNDGERRHESQGHQRPELIDPDPFTVVIGVLGAISSAASVFAVIRSERNTHREERRRRKHRLAAVHRWEAELIELQDLLRETRDFMARVGQRQDKPYHMSPLEPLRVSLYLSHNDLNTYRELVGQLFTQAKNLHDTACELLPYLEDTRVSGFLHESAMELRELLGRLKEFHSVERSLETALGAAGMLLKTAEYLRRDLLD